MYRVGETNGAALANTGNPVFLDEYSSSGTLVQSIGLPRTASGGQHQLIASGSASSEGALSMSADGQFIVLTGYASNIPAAASLGTTAAATVPRTIGLVKFDGSIDTSTALTDLSDAGNVREATSSDGQNLWAVGQTGGVRYATKGATTSTQVAADALNNRSIDIFGGNLFVSTQNTAGVIIGEVGTGLPTTTGQTTVDQAVPAAANPEEFFFATLSGGRVLYIADSTAATSSIQKFALVAGTWTAEGTVSTGTDVYRGLAGTLAGDTVTLYATRNGNELVKLVDASGFNAALTGTPTSLAIAPVNQAFRGVTAAPLAQTGFVPPSKAASKCPDAVAKNVIKLAACVRKCHVAQADAALKVSQFDEEGCENTCVTKYGTAASGIATKDGCPNCLDLTAQTSIGTLVATTLDSEEGDLYCAGSTPLGGDDPGFVPPDKDTGKCEDSVAKAISKLHGCFANCQIKNADAAVKASAFDRNACQVSGVKSCRGKYDAGVTKLLVKPCQTTTCLDAAGQGAVADGAQTLLQQLQAQIYCEGTTPLP